MFLVKVSTPWTHIDYNTRIPKSGIINDYHFDFSEKEIECDFWIIWGGIKGFSERAICNLENVIYLTDEVHDQRFYLKSFINQFSHVITCREDINHKSVIASHELNTWMIKHDFDSLLSPNIIEKSKQFSIVSSDQTWLPGHKKRFAFVNKMIGYFGNRVEVFGRGFNEVEDKSVALLPFKYSLAIENSVKKGYFTEKLSDCFLTHTMPIYYGCPDINRYFDKSSMLIIDINNFEQSRDSIEQLLEEDPYNLRLDSIIASKIKYLNQYHIFNALTTLLEKFIPKTIKKERIIIKSESQFNNGYKINSLLNKLYYKLNIPSNLRFEIVFNQSNHIANISTKKIE